MVIREQSIVELRLRLDISYAEAEKLLVRANGNIDQAIDIAIRKRNSKITKFKKFFAKLIRTILFSRLVVTNPHKTYLDLPLLILFVLVHLVYFGDFLIWTAILLILGLVNDCEFRFVRPEDGRERATYNYKTVAKDQLQAAKRPQEVETEGTVDSAVVNKYIRPHQKPEVKPQTEAEMNKEKDFYEITIDK